MSTTKVNTIAAKYLDTSMLRKSKKSQRKFEFLTRKDKREWREILQRKISAARVGAPVRCAIRAFAVKPKGKNSWKLNRISRAEIGLISAMEDSVELQSGKIAVGAALVAAGYAAYRCATRVSNAAEKVSDEISDLLKQFKRHFEDFVENVRKLGGWLFKFVVAVVGAWFVFNYAAAPAITRIVNMAISRVVPEAGVTEVHQQAGGFESLAALLATLIVPTMGGHAGRMAFNFIKLVPSLPRLSDGLKSFVDLALDYAEQFINWLMRKQGSERFSFGRKKELTEIWRQEVLDLCKRVDTEAHVPIELVYAMRDKVKEGYGLMQLMAHKESKDEIARWVDKLNSRLSPHLGVLSAEHNMRPMPYLAMLGGASGIGKTSVVQVFSSMVLALSGEVPAGEVLQNLWQKGLSEYWNGYVGQRAIIKDDCFQVRGVAGAQDSEAMEIIRGIGNWACPLNFADLQNKGRVYLDVALMVGTTNAVNIQADWEPFITCPEALVRRFQGSYWLELNPEYALNGRYDFEKINNIYAERLDAFAAKRKQNPEWKPTQDDVLDLFPWDAWVVRHHGFNHSNPSDGVILPGGMKEAVKIAADTIKQRKKDHARNVANISRHISAAEEAFAGLEFQAGGPYIIGEGLRAMTSEQYAREHTESLNSDEVWCNPVVKAQCSITTDGDDNVILLDLERADEQWYHKAFGVIREWYAKVAKLIYGMVDYVVPHKELINGVEVHNIEAYIIEGSMWCLLVTGVMKLARVAVHGLWSIVKGLLGLFGVKQQSNNPPAKEKGLPKFEFPRVALQHGAQPDEAVNDNVYKNMYTLSLNKSGHVTQLGTMLSIGGAIFVMPKHFDVSVAKASIDDVSTKLEFVHCYTSRKVTMDTAVFMKADRAPFEEGIDLVGIRMPNYAAMGPNKEIVHYFLRDADISTTLRGTKLATRLDTGRLDKDGTRVTRTTMSSTKLEYVPSVNSHDGTRLKSLVRYEMPTRGGDCGAALSLIDTKYYGGRALLGIHVAGKTELFARYGYATITSYEAMREVWLALCGTVSNQVDMQAAVEVVTGDDFVTLEAAAADKGIIGGSISYLGPAITPVPIATRSAITRSPMHESKPFGPSPVAPAVLHPVFKEDTIVYPMAQAVEAYKSETIVGDPDKLEIAAEVAFKPLFKETEGMYAGVLTFEEAIVPPVNMKLKPINRKTSAGYKYKKYVTPQTPGKTYFLGHEGDVDFSTPAMAELRKDVEGIIYDLQFGRRRLHVCTDFLKDELRSLEKVENVKTRMISGTELDYTIAVRQYFGAFCAAMLATPIVNGMAPGVNHYTQWGVLAEKLIAKGGKVFDGDFTRYDASEQPWVHDVILRVINKWYARHPGHSVFDDDIREGLWDDLIHSVHITGSGCMADQFVQWNKSLPSGHPLTTVVNSMYSLLTLTACYIHLTGDATGMWDHVFINTFGDDNVSGVDDEMCDKFNQVTVAATMESMFGLVYTAGVKDGKLVPYTTIDKVTFLKRSFVVDDDEEGAVIGGAPNVGWVAPLDMKSFLFTPYFYRNKKNSLLDVQGNCEILQCELALHSRDKWEEYNSKLKSWCECAGVELKFDTRAAARAYVKTRFDVWF